MENHKPKTSYKAAKPKFILRVEAGCLKSKKLAKVHYITHKIILNNSFTSLKYVKYVGHAVPLLYWNFLKKNIH